MPRDFVGLFPREQQQKLFESECMPAEVAFPYYATVKLLVKVYSVG